MSLESLKYVSWIGSPDKMVKISVGFDEFNGSVHFVNIGDESNTIESEPQKDID